jgi:hypothetical protein
LSSGLTTNNYINFYSETFNKYNKQKLNSFYREKIDGSLFVNIGLLYKFGKVKSTLNNYNMYNALDLNSTNIENGVNTGYNQVPAKETNIKNISPTEIQDLIDAQDFY